MAYEGPPITLDAVTYHTGAGDSRGTTIQNVAYLGVIERRSDGFTTLSVRKPGSSRAFNVETGNVLSIAAHGRDWRPEAPPNRWALRAAEIRAFVEQVDLEDWAKPYFDPLHEKYHRNQSRRTADPAFAGERSENVRVPLWVQEEIEMPKPGLLGRLWRRLFSAQ